MPSLAISAALSCALVASNTLFEDWYFAQALEISVLILFFVSCKINLYLCLLYEDFFIDEQASTQPSRLPMVTITDEHFSSQIRDKQWNSLGSNPQERDLNLEIFIIRKVLNEYYTNSYDLLLNNNICPKDSVLVGNFSSSLEGTIGNLKSIESKYGQSFYDITTTMYSTNLKSRDDDVIKDEKDEFLFKAMRPKKKTL